MQHSPLSPVCTQEPIQHTNAASCQRRQERKSQPRNVQGGRRFERRKASNQPQSFGTVRPEMNREQRERMNELCQKIKAETDYHKFSELVLRLTALLEEVGSQLKNQSQ